MHKKMPDVAGITPVPTYNMHKHNSTALEIAGDRAGAHKRSTTCEPCLGPAQASRKRRTNPAQLQRSSTCLIARAHDPKLCVYGVMMQSLMQMHDGKRCTGLCISYNIRQTRKWQCMCALQLWAAFGRICIKAPAYIYATVVATAIMAAELHIIA